MSAPHASLLLPALVALLALAGCGSGGGYGTYGVEVGYVEDPYVAEPWIGYGTVAVDNLSAEYVETFYLTPALTDLWTDDLLGWPLAPGEIATVGDFEEDWYDAEADLEYGDWVEWFDVFVPYAEVSVFEVW